MIDTPTEEWAALAEWVQLSEALLRGLIHSLNNRVTALGAFAELASMGDEEFTAQAVLPEEMKRMQQVTYLLRLLLADDSAPEALEVVPVLNDAIALHAQHPRLRSLPCLLSRAGTLLPVRAPRWALLRVLLLMIEGAKQALGTHATEGAAISVAGDEETLTVRVRMDGELPAYAVAMAERCGGTLASVDDVAELSLPTLLAVRRQERATRSGQAEPT